jgi:hypothetical protein
MNLMSLLMCVALRVLAFLRTIFSRNLLRLLSSIISAALFIFLSSQASCFYFCSKMTEKGYGFSRGNLQSKAGKTVDICTTQLVCSFLCHFYNSNQNQPRRKFFIIFPNPAKATVNTVQLYHFI